MSNATNHDVEVLRLQLGIQKRLNLSLIDDNNVLFEESRHLTQENTNLINRLNYADRRIKELKG
jgi:hypothetical protein